MTTDELIDSVGGLGRFQAIHCMFILGLRLVMAGGMMMMSFAGVESDWWCIPDRNRVIVMEEDESIWNSTDKNNKTFHLCPEESNQTCSIFYSPEMDTIINEWDLVCSESTIPVILTSIQMAGVLVGALVAGQTADALGRKKPFYVTTCISALANLAAGFSVSWQMFGAVRFFIGFGVGAFLVISYPYMMEFVGQQWRQICSAVPTWQLGVGLLALLAWLQPNWAHQHFINAGLHLPFLLGWFFVPESLRWLTVNGRLDEAERVVEQMCRYNRKPKPQTTVEILKKVSAEEAKHRNSGKKYTYIDIYKGRRNCYKSIVIQIIWAALSLVYYGMSFGAGKLSGNLYLNICLLAAVEIPGSITIYFIVNKLGRRWTAFSFFGIGTVSAFSVVVVSVYGSTYAKDSAINPLALVSKLGIGAGWATFQVMTNENYPTTIRNLGYGAANTFSRVGGIVAPFLFSGAKGDVFMPFMIVGSVMGASTLITLTLDETTGQPLRDTIVSKQGHQPNVDKNNEIVLNVKDLERGQFSPKTVQ